MVAKHMSWRTWTKCHRSRLNLCKYSCAVVPRPFCSSVPNFRISDRRYRCSSLCDPPRIVPADRSSEDCWADRSNDLRLFHQPHLDLRRKLRRAPSNRSVFLPLCLRNRTKRPNESLRTSVIRNPVDRSRRRLAHRNRFLVNMELCRHALICIQNARATINKPLQYHGYVISPRNGIVSCLRRMTSASLRYSRTLFVMLKVMADLRH